MAIHYQQALQAVAALVKDPFDYPAAQRLADGLADWRPMRHLYRRLIAHLRPDEVEHLRALTFQPLDVDALLALPATTFGHRYAAYLRHKRLDPEAAIAAFPPIADRLSEDWLLRRFVKTHDMIHLLFDFDVDVPGEMGLQVFNALNFREPYGLLAVLSVPRVIARYGQPLRTLREMRRGFHLARSTRNLFCFPFEELMETDLEDVRRRVRAAGG